jgi:hypothetical protein
MVLTCVVVVSRSCVQISSQPYSRGAVAEVPHSHLDQPQGRRTTPSALDSSASTVSPAQKVEGLFVEWRLPTGVNGFQGTVDDVHPKPCPTPANRGGVSAAQSRTVDQANQEQPLRPSRQPATEASLRFAGGPGTACPPQYPSPPSQTLEVNGKSIRNAIMPPLSLHWAHPDNSLTRHGPGSTRHQVGNLVLPAK